MIKHSPLTFKFISETAESIEEETKPGIHAVGVAAPIKVHHEKNSGGASNPRAKAAETQPNDIVKTFTLRINPSQSYYEHKTNIRLSPTHGPWPEFDSAQIRREDQDFVYLALKDVVPDNIARTGLCDWHTSGQLSGEPVAMRAQAADARLWHIKERQKRRMVRDRGSGLQAQLGGDLTAVSSLDALCGSTDEGQRQGPSTDIQNGADADLTEVAGPPAPPPKVPVPPPKAAASPPKAPAAPPKTPAWVRRKQTKLNPLADGKHSKIIKKLGVQVGVQKGSHKWKSVFKS